MLRLIPAIAAAAMLCGTGAANATEWMHCGDAGDEVQLGFLLGGLDFTQVSGLTLRIGTEQWTDSPAYGPGKPLALGDYFFDWKILNATVDENHETVLAELRVVLIESENDIAKGGVMHVPGKGVFVVACDGP